MSPERFEHLAQAYGGDLRRWPVATRAAAADLLRTRPELERRLTMEAATDALLDASPRSVPSAGLRARVLAAAPAERVRAAWQAGWTWLSGAGLAGACAAGLAVGVLVGPPPVQDDLGALAVLAPYDPLAAVDAEIVG